MSSETPPILPVDMMTCLRQKTHDLHTRIESRLDFSVHFASRAKYRKLLERYYGFYLPFEAYLAAPERAVDWVTLGIDFAARRKTQLLADDLRMLGLGTPERLGLPLCPQNTLPRPRSASELIGCTYVLEGATLGGKVIGRYVEQALGLTVGAPGAYFFYGYGTETGTMWKQFRYAAEAFAEREKCRAFRLRQAMRSAGGRFCSPNLRRIGNPCVFS